MKYFDIHKREIFSRKKLVASTGHNYSLSNDKNVPNYLKRPICIKYDRADSIAHL